MNKIKITYTDETWSLIFYEEATKRLMMYTTGESIGKTIKKIESKEGEE